MSCDGITTFKLSDSLVSWSPVGDIAGFADGEDSVQIQPSDDGKNTMKVSGDGVAAVLEVNERYNGTAVLKLSPGSPLIGILIDQWHTDKSVCGEMRITRVSTQESWLLKGTAMEIIPNISAAASKAPDSYDFPFLYKASKYTPGRESVAAIANG